MQNRNIKKISEKETITFVHLVFLFSTFRSSVLKPNLHEKINKMCNYKYRNIVKPLKINTYTYI